MDDVRISFDDEDGTIEMTFPVEPEAETMTDEEWAQAKEDMRIAGAEDGEAAGSWLIDGNTTTETAAEILRQIEECELETPSPLSGEWAGDPTSDEIIRRVTDCDPESLSPEERDELETEYLDAWQDAYHTEAERSARAALNHDGIDVESATSAYIECALWSSTDDNGEPLDASFDVFSIASESREAMKADVVSFLDLVRERRIDLSGWDSAQFGHDFWLTRNGHGAGFWDRGIDPAGSELTTWANTYGSSDLYVGDDGFLYVS